jgi:hypothetical protein
VKGGKPIADVLQSISDVSALVAFYDIHRGKRGAILLFCPGHHTRQNDDRTVNLYVSLLLQGFQR